MKRFVILSVMIALCASALGNHSTPNISRKQSELRGHYTRTLKQYNVKATFFVVNQSDNLNYLIKREYDEGHTVALHSNTHRYDLIYSSVDAYFNDLYTIGNKVKNITGVDS